MTTKAGTLQGMKMKPLLAKCEVQLLPTAAAANDLKTTTNISALTLEVTSFTAQPSYARNVVLTVTDGSVALTGGTFIIKGLDQNGKPVSETFTYTAAGAYTGDVAFSVLQSILFALTGAVTGPPTFTLGSGTKHGLAVGADGELVEVYKAAHAGAIEAVGTVDKTYATIIPTSPSGADHSQAFWFSYRLKVPE